MGVQVQFNYDSWVARYPEFNPATSGVQQPVTAPQATAYFAEASIFHRNDGGGPVSDAATQTALLNMVTAHIAALNAPSVTGQPASTLVGRIDSATEGSVTVSTTNDYPPGTPQWWQQTRYGSSYWNLTYQFRTFQYKPRMTRTFDRWPF